MSKTMSSVPDRNKPPVKQVLVEEPVSQRPDVPGEKPDTYQFRDFALI